MKKPTPKIYRTINCSSCNRPIVNQGIISIWFDPKIQWYAHPQGKQGNTELIPILLFNVV